MRTEADNRNRILEYSFKAFSSMGFQQVTMDDIARGVGMGKGTVYKLFPSKDALIMDTIDFFARQMEERLRIIIADDQLTPEDKLKLFTKTVYKQLKKVNPAVLASLERVMPEAYHMIEQKRQKLILTNVKELIDEGKKSGIFVEGTDGKLIAHILIGSIRHLTEYDVISGMDYNVEQLFSSIITVIMRGCMTEEGRRVFL